MMIQVYVRRTLIRKGVVIVERLVSLFNYLLYIQMFFGKKVSQNSPLVISNTKTNVILNISTACLDQKSDADKTYLHLNIDGLRYNLCNLQKDLNDFRNIGVFLPLNEEKKFKFEVTGSNNVVLLIGLLESEEGNDEQDKAIEITNASINHQNSDKNTNNRLDFEGSDEDSDSESRNNYKKSRKIIKSVPEEEINIHQLLGKKTQHPDNKPKVIFPQSNSKPTTNNNKNDKFSHKNKSNKNVNFNKKN
jgi:hypothetical protein